MKWRQKKAASAEDSLFCQGYLDHAENMNSGHAAVGSCLAEWMVWKEQAKNLLLIFLDETRMRRTVEKDIAALDAM